MNLYEKLGFKEADLVWDCERPEEDREMLLDEIRKQAGLEEPDPCNHDEKCWECPNFKDCLGTQAIPSEVGGRP